MLWKMNVSNSCDVSNTRSLLVLPMFSRLTKIALRGTMGPFIFAFYRRQYGSTIIETLDIAPGHRAPHMDSSNPPFNYNRRDGGQMTNLLDSGTNPLCNLPLREYSSWPTKVQEALVTSAAVGSSASTNRQITPTVGQHRRQGNLRNILRS